MLIVDVGSTNNTKEIAEKYLIDKKVKYIYQKNAGVCVTKNNDAKQALGDYLSF